MKRTIKEEIGKASSARDLRIEGKAEKKAGKVQQRMGDAKRSRREGERKLAEFQKAG